ncbi:hypothetical protein [Okeania sp. SIO2C2]|uniref:hypothetical protein n=1 Tax=Okeania sp. SIO2C2 TaxID=2607787 RepID=UPI00257CDE65|nr:hypothetical protein [Okeania sp. SIO2C2]
MKELMELAIDYIYYYFGNKQTSFALAESLKKNHAIVRYYSGFFRKLGVSLH